jgi:hypothetical protein
MAKPGLEKIILDGPFHQTVVDGRTANALVVLNSLIVITFQRGQIGSFKVMFVCEAARDED